MSLRKQPDRSNDVYSSKPSGDDVDAGLESVEGEVGEEVRKTVSALMPWGVSILAHMALLVLAFFLVWQTIVVNPEEQPPPVGLADTPKITPMQETQDKDASPLDAGTPPIVPVVEVPTPTNVVVPGVDLPQPYIPNPDTGTTGIDQGPGDGGGGINEGIVDVTGGAKKVVYLIDASGSMVDVLPFVVNELKQSTSKLNASYKATILIFSGEGVFEVPGGGGVRGLRPLTANFKQQINEWVTLSNHKFETGGPGGEHVLTAIDRALSYKPQLVFLLSDNLTGGGQGATRHELLQSDIMKVVKKYKDATPSARINTIQFLYEDPLVRAGLVGTLRLIADESGGEFRFLNQEDLKLR